MHFFCIGGISSLFLAIAAHNFRAKYVSNYGFLCTSYIGAGTVATLLFPVMLTHLQWQGLIVSGISAADLVLRTTFQLTFLEN